MSDMTLPERLKALESKLSRRKWETKRRGFGYPDVEGGPIRCLLDVQEAWTGYPIAGGTIHPDSDTHMELIVELRNALPELLSALENDARYRWLAADGDRARRVLNENSGLDVEAAIDAGLDDARPTACATKGDGNGR